MKVLVIGATGGSGRAAVTALLDRGHDVTVMVRTVEAQQTFGDGPIGVIGDATRPDDVDRAVRGQDAVIVTLGITENPVRVRLRGPARTALDVRSTGTRNIIDAMQRHGVRRLIVQTTYGVGDTDGRLPLRYKLMFSLLLGPQVADTVIQDRFVHESGLDWTLVQPVNLTDSTDGGDAFTSTSGELVGWQVARSKVGRVLASAVDDEENVRRTVAVS
ncbi:putative NAD(P)-binding protein [Rhodococcus sp. SMB37]|uniref:NAD(P)-dependent oxidoreductase n=1 Tax=Rhodococcus sp. SMB37 TaxID=2512213 RepID=UPI0006D0A739|nr:NAD(P)-binding oxidoreductase [Rhodococcus sp. SMB37]TCN50501.1 putative NAD(P)-binding protein [Rhodococcus sp. SMB37]